MDRTLGITRFEEPPPTKSDPKRGRRSGPQSESEKAKAAKMRENRACFPCQVLRQSCSEERPCQGCKAANSRRTRSLKWMGCITIPLAMHCIYNAELGHAKSMPADTEHHVFAAIDDFSLFLELPAALSLEFLATDIANWITHTNSGIAVGKVDLLCSVTFQELAGGALGHEFIRHFRLVLWITTLSQTAKHNTTFLAQTQAMDTLERWLHFYGKNVVLHLDTKCRAHSIRKLSGEECKALFLVIIGMCLSATYAHPARNNSTVSSFTAHTHPKSQEAVYIESLANIGTYFGHECCLFASDVDSQALVTAAKWRRDLRGEFISSKLSKRLDAELSDGSIWSAIPTLNHNKGSDPLRPAYATEETFSKCAECSDARTPCCLCEFTNLYDSPEARPEAPAARLMGMKLPQAEDKAVKETSGNANSHRRAHEDSIGLHTPPPNWPAAENRVTDTALGTSHRLDLWNCCNCLDGAKVIAIEPSCSQCQHEICGGCGAE